MASLLQVLDAEGVDTSRANWYSKGAPSAPTSPTQGKGYLGIERMQAHDQGGRGYEVEEEEGTGRDVERRTSYAFEMAQEDSFQHRKPPGLESGRSRFEEQHGANEDIELHSSGGGDDGGVPILRHQLRRMDLVRLTDLERSDSNHSALSSPGNPGRRRGGLSSSEAIPLRPSQNSRPEQEAWSPASDGGLWMRQGRSRAGVLLESPPLSPASGGVRVFRFEGSSQRLQEQSLGYQEGPRGYQEGARGNQEGARGYQEGARGYQEGARGYQEGARGNQEGSTGYQEGARGYHENARGYQETARSSPRTEAIALQARAPSSPGESKDQGKSITRGDMVRRRNSSGLSRSMMSRFAADAQREYRERSSLHEKQECPEEARGNGGLIDLREMFQRTDPNARPSSVPKSQSVTPRGMDRDQAQGQSFQSFHGPRPSAGISFSNQKPPTAQGQPSSPLGNRSGQGFGKPNASEPPTPLVYQRDPTSLPPCPPGNNQARSRPPHHPSRKALLHSQSTTSAGSLYEILQVPSSQKLGGQASEGLTLDLPSPRSCPPGPLSLASSGDGGRNSTAGSTGSRGGHNNRGLEQPVASAAGSSSHGFPPVIWQHSSGRRPVGPPIVPPYAGHSAYPPRPKATAYSVGTCQFKEESAVVSPRFSLTAETALALGFRKDLSWTEYVLRKEYRDVFQFYALSRKELESGQSGSVRQCKDRETGEVFACKTISKKKISLLPVAEDIRKEVACLTLLRHQPHIVTLRETFEDEESIHIIMECCQGGDLHNYVSEVGCLKEREAAMVCRQLAVALQKCHNFGIIHRDVKPENVLLGRADALDSVKLVDFGISTFHVAGDKINDFVGTPEYMAPEVFLGAYSFEADLWSLGCVLYFLLSGTLPFSGKDCAALKKATTTRELSFKGKAWLLVSSHCKLLLQKMLAKSPRDRITTAQLLCDPWFSALGLN